MTGFLFITAFTVSIDSFACGFSLAFNGKGKNKFIVALVIALTVFAMCAAANYAAAALTEILSEKTASLGGLILVGVGVFNLIKPAENTEATKSLNGANENLKNEKSDCAKREKGKLVRQSLLAGFAVGLDGAAANLSLAIMGINGFYVPVVIAVMHAVMIVLGIVLSNVPFIKKASRLNFIPPLVLIFLGLYKLLPLVMQ